MSIFNRGKRFIKKNVKQGLKSLNSKYKRRRSKKNKSPDLVTDNKSIKNDISNDTVVKKITKSNSNQKGKKKNHTNTSADPYVANIQAADKLLSEANKALDNYTLTEAQRKDKRVLAKVAAIPAVGGIVSGVTAQLGDIADKQQKRELKHQSEITSEYFKYLYGNDK